MREPLGETPTFPIGNEIFIAENADEPTSVATESGSLEAATRLVDPMRLNTLMPEEITPRHLRKANRAVRRIRHHLVGLQNAAQQVLQAARVEAQRGQQLARTNQNQRRARRVQGAIRRASDLYAHYDALEEERARFARKVAAARTLLEAWENEKSGLAKRRTGLGAARALKQTTLNIARVERVTRDRLEEARRALAHVTVAEDAMRRDGEMVRLDPVAFRRFAGRGRWGVRLGIVALIVAILALVYPPWSPPHLALGCTFPAGLHNTCESVHATSGLRIVNQGSGVLIGWATVTLSQPSGTTAQVIPLMLLPNGSRSLTCGDYSGCAAQTGGNVQVQITTSGGSDAVSVVP